MGVRVPRALFQQTLDQLRACGNGQSECVAYWIADQDEPHVILRLVHPEHRSGSFGYEVDSGYVTQFFLDLRRDRETVRVQVHTHPAEASHSRTDDLFALAPAPGFLSLVIPGFALGPAVLVGCHLVEIGDDGNWNEIDPEVTIELV